jgi:hypothetical protein
MDTGGCFPGVRAAVSWSWPQNSILWQGQEWWSYTSTPPYVFMVWRLLTYLLTYGDEPFLRSCQLCSHSRTSQHFREPEGSSSCSQEPSTGPYPEPDRSSPYPSYLFKIYFNIVHPPTSWSSWWSLSFSLSHQYSICTPLLPIHAICPAHLILSWRGA